MSVIRGGAGSGASRRETRRMDAAVSAILAVGGWVVDGFTAMAVSDAQTKWQRRPCPVSAQSEQGAPVIGIATACCDCIAIAGTGTACAPAIARAKARTA